jgi:LL-diaminopimelate aminotransferase
VIQPSKRLTNLPPYIFATINQKIQKLQAQGIDVIRLDIGNPDGEPPPDVINALMTYAQRPDTHGYSSYTGIKAFRDAVAAYYARRFQVEINPDTQVLPLMGSKEGLVNLCLAYLNPGDTVLLPDIGYPPYARGVMLAGAQIEWLPLKLEQGFIPDLNAVGHQRVEQARMFWMNYPNNPTGAIADLAFYQEAVNFCQAHDILLVSDNPYFDITFDGCHAGSVLQVPNALSCSVEFISFSKTYNMGGWRLGAAIGNADVIRLLLQMKSNVDTGHFIPIYHAGIAALESTTDDWATARNQTYQRRRDLVLAHLAGAGLDAHKPLGAMYVWAKTQIGDGDQYVGAALDTAHVTLTPGSAFGPGGHEYVRISLGTPDDRLQLALQRLQTMSEV